MISRKLLSVGAATCAVIAAAPAFAQPEMTYEQKPYQYAQPAPAPAPQQAPIIYRQDPVVQPIPVRAPAPVAQENYETEYEYRPAAPHHTQPVHSHAPIAHHQTVYPQHHVGQVPTNQPAFDRDAWIDECLDRVGSRFERRGGGSSVVGGLVGAAAGGLIGNRIAGRGDRLAGSVIGAGVGGLAGAAVGSAVDRSNSRRGGDALAYCEDWLARYSGSGYQTGHHQYAYGYQYAQPMMLVQVMVPVQQRAVVKEYITEEVVDVEVVTYEDVYVPRQRMIKQAPKPVKRVPTKPVYRKAQPVKRTKQVKSIKGN